jgi:hypothetical protein
MTRACHTAVRMATGEAFTEAEIDDFLDRLAEKAKRARKDAPTISEREAIAQAAGELTREQLMGALVEKRLRAAANIAQKARRARLDAMPASMDEAQRLHAYDLGSETQGQFTSSSVDAEGRARAMGLWGQVELGLRQTPGLINRISNFWGGSEREVDRKIAREMARLNGDGSIEPTGDEGALHAAQVFAKALDDGRLMQNDQGAFIQKLPGYIARQSHDRLKVAGGFWRELAEIGRRIPEEKLKAFDWRQARTSAAKRAFRQWRDFIRPKLDPRTFEGLELEDVPWENWEDEAQQSRQERRGRDLEHAGVLARNGVIDDPTSLEERMLYRVWADIVTGRHEQLSGMDDLGEFRPPASTARSVSKARVLHFSSPDHWMDYNTRYGSGSLFRTVMGQLERSARNAALMQRWGPAPETARAAEIERLSQRARARGDVQVARRLAGARQQSDFEAITGRLNVPESLRLAMIARGIRSWEGVTKLGSIVLSKATDLPMTGHTFARAGAGFLKGYEGALRGITHLQGEEGRRAAELLDVGARSFAGHLSGQFSAGDGLLGWNAWAARLMYRINLFEFVNEGVRRGAAEMLARHLGEEAAHPFEGLQQGTRESFQRFGIDKAAWETVRKGLQPADDGHTYFTLDHLDQLPRTKAFTDRHAAELGLRFRTMIHDTIDNTTSEPRLREQAGLAGLSSGARAGTIWGEAARSFGQFRGFLQTILGRHLAPAWGGYAGYAPVALMAHFIVASALAGWLSMNAKLIAKGQAPRSLVGDSLEETAKIWAASLAQGGGLGIYGDYLFGEQNRNGLEFTLSSVAGPAVGDLEQVAQIVRQATHGGAISPTTGQSQIPGELARLGAHNIPLVNLWYTRLALDYLVLWRLQEAVSPGYLQRYENRVRNDEGGGFIVSPTSAQ